MLNTLLIKILLSIRCRYRQSVHYTARRWRASIRHCRTTYPICNHDLVVVDSVAALVPRSEIEGEMGDSKMGLCQINEPNHENSPVLSVKHLVVVFFINQLRDKIGYV